MNKAQPPFNCDELNKIINNASTEQLAWISGYLWAIANKNVLSPEKSMPKDETSHDANSSAQVKTITIVSASQTGNARRIAQELCHDLERLGLPFIHVHAADYNFKKIDQDEFLIIVTSTQGDGEPPEEALAFYKFLLSKKAPKLPHLHYSVFGLGDSSYVHFCQAGKYFDERLSELGANRLFERVDADTDYQTTSEHWRQNIIEYLIKAVKSDVSRSDSQVINSNIIVENSRYNRDNPFVTTINVNQKITADHSQKDIRHIEIDLTDSGIQYQAGDSLGVWYQNSLALVDELLEVTQFDASAMVDLYGESYPLKQVLIEKVELTQNTPIIVEKYANLTEQSELLKLINDKVALRDFCQVTPLIDMISQFPSKLNVQDFINILRPITPRFYSIASAQSEVGNEVHLTVNVVRYQVDGKLRTGGASYFLANQVAEQSKINVFIENNDNFRLPSDNRQPIIMIGAGTGVAPFRAFIQQRAYESAPGKNWLFFGNPHFTADFLYQVEWQKYVKQGVLTRIDLAWSRDQSQKVYVQDKLLAQACDIWAWLQQGAYIYVCGDSNNMAKAVNSTLLQIIMQQGQYSEEQATDYLDELRYNKRYQRDIY